MAIKLIAAIVAACALLLTLGLRTRHFEKESPLTVLTANAPARLGLAAVIGAPAKPAHTEVASFAAG